MQVNQSRSVFSHAKAWAEQGTALQAQGFTGPTLQRVDQDR